MLRFIAVSNSEMSQSQPTPSRRAPQSPHISASAAAYPVAMSTSESPVLTGGPSGSPVSDIHPA